MYEWYKLTRLFDPKYLRALYIIPIHLDILFFTLDMCCASDKVESYIGKDG